MLALAAALASVQSLVGGLKAVVAIHVLRRSYQIEYSSIMLSGLGLEVALFVSSCLFLWFSDSCRNLGEWKDMSVVVTSLGIVALLVQGIYSKSKSYLFRAKCTQKASHAAHKYLLLVAILGCSFPILVTLKAIQLGNDTCDHSVLSNAVVGGLSLFTVSIGILLAVLGT